MIALLEAVPLQSGAIVMATGIVAIGLSRIRASALADPLLALGALIWVVVMAAVAVRARVDPGPMLAELRLPGALSLVAATAVLGVAAAGLGWTLVPSALLGLAAAGVLGLGVLVLRRWRTPTRGASFLLAVAVASVSVLASTVSRLHHVAWLGAAAAAIWLLSLAAYVFVVRSFELGEVIRGKGDQWVAGGALAIATLGGSELWLTLRLRQGQGRLPLELAVVVLWVAATAWLVALLAGELANWRWGYHHLRWATVFPLGMYGVSSLEVGSITGVVPLAILARVFIWTALAAWLLVAAALLPRILAAVTGRPQPLPDAPGTDSD